MMLTKIHFPAIEPMDGLVEMGLSTCADRCFRAQWLRYICLDL